MNRKSFYGLLLGLILLCIAIFGKYQQKTQLDHTNYLQSSRPTLFFHGYGSSANAEKHMTDAAKKAGVTQTVITANVAEDGQVRLTGTIPKQSHARSKSHQQLCLSGSQKASRHLSF